MSFPSSSVNDLKRASIVGEDALMVEREACINNVCLRRKCALLTYTPNKPLVNRNVASTTEMRKVWSTLDSIESYTIRKGMGGGGQQGVG